jgi:hypothetical protein
MTPATEVQASTRRRTQIEGRSCAVPPATRICAASRPLCSATEMASPEMGDGSLIAECEHSVSPLAHVAIRNAHEHERPYPAWTRALEATVQLRRLRPESLASGLELTPPASQLPRRTTGQKFAYPCSMSWRPAYPPSNSTSSTCRSSAAGLGLFELVVKLECNQVVLKSAPAPVGAQVVLTGREKRRARLERRNVRPSASVARRAPPLGESSTTPS